MIPDTLYQDLLTACSQPGCPVCRLENSAIDNYLQTALREKLNDQTIRQDIKDSLGFCREHSWRMRSLGLGKTMAATLGYHDVLLAVVQQLQRVDLAPRQPKRSLSLRKRVHAPGGRFETIVKALTPPKSCPACRIGEDYSRSILGTLADSIQDQTVSNAFVSSDGLCLPHLRQAFALIEDEETCKTFLTLNIERFEGLRREVIAIFRKIEQRDKKSTSQDDDETWQKVINAVNGER